MRRWRKRDDKRRQLATLVISPELIRSVISDDPVEGIPESLYDFVWDLNDEDLYRIGASILDDLQFWLVLREFVVGSVESLQFVRMMNDMNADRDQDN